MLELEQIRSNSELEKTQAQKLDEEEFQLHASSTLGARLQSRCVALKQALRRLGGDAENPDGLMADVELGVADEQWVHAYVRTDSKILSR